MSDPLISLQNVSLAGVDTNKRSTSLKTLLLSWGKKSGDWKIPILHDINLKVEAGERVGIIGPNGAGKSSLLRVIAGVYPPTTGTRQVMGSIAPILNAALGFRAESTGRQNIQLALMHNRQLGKFTPELERQIIEFSELGHKIDWPIKIYSSGMLARLAFSVTFFQQADIMLLDEIFAMGDQAFRIKSRQKVLDSLDHSSIVVIVSHKRQLIRELCSRCLYIKDGRIELDGETLDVLKQTTP